MDFEPLDANKFKNFFDIDQRLINEHEFRKSIFKAGVDESIRQETWKFLFQYYLYNSTERERIIRDTELQVEYAIMRLRWQQLYEFCKNLNEDKISNDSIVLPALPFNINLSYLKNDYNSLVNIDSIKIQTILKISRLKLNLQMLLSNIKQIDKDVPRTGYLIEFDDKPDKKEDLDRLSLSLKNILVTFSAFHQVTGDEIKIENCDLGYTQGMNELASVFLCVFQHDESVAYWCYSNYMLLDQHQTSGISLNTVEIDKNHSLKMNIAYHFSNLGISIKLKQLSKMLENIDMPLFKRLKEFNLDNLYFCHEWLLLCFKRSFDSTNGVYLNFFEKIASHFIELNTAAKASGFKEKQININKIFTFDLFICLALIEKMRDEIIDKKTCESDCDVYNLVRYNYKDYLKNNFNKIFNQAEEIFNNYSIVI